MLVSKRNMLSCMILRANETYSSRALLVEHLVHAYGQAIIHEQKSICEHEHHVMSILNMIASLRTFVRQYSRKLPQELWLRLPLFFNTC